MMLIELISYLAHPYLDITQELCSIHLNDRVLAEVFSLLQSNKVLLRVLSFKGLKKFPKKSKVLSRFINRSRVFEASYKHGLNLKEESLDVIAKLNKRSIKSVFIKSLNALPLDSDNFDILVNEKDLSAAVDVLRNSGFLRIDWYREPYKLLFRKAKAPHVAVHLHTAVAWHGIKFVDVKDLWKEYREKEINGVVVGFPSPEHHLLITTAHAIFENREFRLGDLVYLIEDIEGNDLDWSYILDQTIHDGWFDSFYGLLGLVNHTYMAIFGNWLISEETRKRLVKESRMQGSSLAKKLIDQFDKEPLLPAKIATTTVALHLAKKILRTPDIPLPRRMKAIWQLISRFLKRKIPILKKHPAFLVCFIGQDGTGKTTHANYVWEELKQMSKEIRVKYIWSRGFGYSFQPFLVLAKRLLQDDGSSKTSQRRDTSRRASLLKREPMKSLWACVMIVDHLLQLAKVRLVLLLGYVVICDRWVIDTLVDVKCDLGKPLNRFLEGKIESLAPRPEMAFVMDAEISELIKRRPEISADILEYRRHLYLKYSQRKAFQVIKTHDDLERNRNSILSSIIEGFLSHSK